MYLLSRLAQITGSEVVGDPGFEVQGINDLASAREMDIAPLLHPGFIKDASSSSAGAFLITRTLARKGRPQDKPALINENGSLALARLIPLLRPEKKHSVYTGEMISPGADIHESADIATGVIVEPEAVIEEDVVIEPGSVIHRGVRVGKGCVIGSGAVIMHDCRLGTGVVVCPGAVIGSDGFGFAVDEAGDTVKIPQVGNVIVEDDVRIGANCTIDRATLGSTIIRKGSKLDNLVHVAHNVDIGEMCFMAAQTGIAGSCRIGSRVQLGGQAGIADHVSVGDDVRVAAKSGVPSDIPAGSTFAGIPAMPIEKWRRIWAFMKRSVKGK